MAKQAPCWAGLRGVESRGEAVHSTVPASTCICFPPLPASPSCPRAVTALTLHFQTKASAFSPCLRNVGYEQSNTSSGVRSGIPSERHLCLTVLYHSVVRADDCVHGSDCPRSSGLVTGGGSADSLVSSRYPHGTLDRNGEFVQWTTTVATTPHCLAV